MYCNYFGRASAYIHMSLGLLECYTIIRFDEQSTLEIFGPQKYIHSVAVKN